MYESVNEAQDILPVYFGLIFSNSDEANYRKLFLQMGVDHEPSHETVCLEQTLGLRSCISTG